MPFPDRLNFTPFSVSWVSPFIFSISRFAFTLSSTSIDAVRVSWSTSYVFGAPLISSINGFPSSFSTNLNFISSSFSSYSTGVFISFNVYTLFMYKSFIVSVPFSFVTFVLLSFAPSSVIEYVAPLTSFSLFFWCFITSRLYFLDSKNPSFDGSVCV